jgi:hypothetical protein
MPPIKKIAKLASGREAEVKKWLPLVRAIVNNNKTKVITDFLSKFLVKFIFFPN